MRKRKNRIYSKQVLHLTSTPPLSKIRSAGILSIWQKETTSSHIWTAIKFEYFDLKKMIFLNSLIFPWFSAKFQIPWFFPAGIFFSPFSVFQCAWPPCSKWPSFEPDLEIIKTNILSKFHDDCFKNVTARVLTRFSADLAWWPSFLLQVTQFWTRPRNHQDKHFEQASWWLLQKCDR